ncbi:uncharacterized protein AruCF_4419 [Achromobacter ruhlandii]|nr:uncharacterized protein AruCF_4419 [Achromobacter ruhlandii]
MGLAQEGLQFAQQSHRRRTERIAPGRARTLFRDGADYCRGRTGAQPTAWSRRVPVKPVQ